jgi:hypothetical protein
MMRKTILLLLSATLFTFGSRAEDFVIDGTGVLTSYNGAGGDVEIPVTVTAIGDSAFYDCANVTSVTIPASVTGIGRHAFRACTGLTEIIVDAANPNYSSLAGVLFNQDQTALIHYPEGKTATSYDIPASVVGIGEAAFSHAQMTSVTIPTSVTGIGEAAFEACALTSAAIPSSVDSIKASAFEDCIHLASVTVEGGTYIGAYAFSHCDTLAVVDLPASLIKIDEWAFTGCPRLTAITIPASVTSIGTGAFRFCGLTNVTAGATPPSLAVNVFDDPSYQALHVPAGAEAAYAAAPFWIEFGAILGIGETAVLTASPDTLAFTTAGGTLSLIITSNVGWWSDAAVPWLTPDSVSGSGINVVGFTAGVNTDDVRTVEHVLTGVGGATCTIVFTQASPLNVAPDTLFFTAAAESKNIAVTANIPWTAVSDTAWAVVFPASDANDGVASVAVEANTGSARTATVTIAGGSLSRTVVIAQAAYIAPPTPTLTVSTGALHFPAEAYMQQITVASNANWTATCNAMWVTIAPAAGSGDSTVSITVAFNVSDERTATITFTGGGGIKRTVAVTQDANQQIVAQPSQPVGDRGTIDVSLSVPVDEPFIITIAINLPAGFTLDTDATTLAPALVNNHQLTIVPTGSNNWTLEIKPALATLAATAYQEVVQIAYTIDASVAKGAYTAKLTNLNLTVDAGQEIHQDEVTVTLTVTSPVGNIPVETAIRYADGILTVLAPGAEQIDVYSVGGTLLRRLQKAPGEATFHLALPRGVWIVKGGSGWTRKIVE